MHPYRTHTCGQLRLSDGGATVRLSGWVHRKRDHGNLLFVDLRDHYGVTQCVIDTSSPLFPVLEGARLETVLTVTGSVVARSADTVNPNIPTGEVEVSVEQVSVQAEADPLPLQVNSEAGTNCLRYLCVKRKPSLTCGVRRSTATSCCGPRSSPRSAGA